MRAAAVSSTVQADRTVEFSEGLCRDREAELKELLAVLRNNDANRQIQKYTKALEANSDSIHLRHWRAKAYAELEDYSSALQDIREILEADPRHQGALSLRRQINISMETSSNNRLEATGVPQAPQP